MEFKRGHQVQFGASVCAYVLLHLNIELSQQLSTSVYLKKQYYLLLFTSLHCCLLAHIFSSYHGSHSFDSTKLVESQINYNWNNFRLLIHSLRSGTTPARLQVENKHRIPRSAVGSARLRKENKWEDCACKQKVVEPFRGDSPFRSTAGPLRCNGEHWTIGEVVCTTPGFSSMRICLEQSSATSLFEMNAYMDEVMRKMRWGS